MFLQVIVIDEYTFTFFFNSGDFVFGKKFPFSAAVKMQNAKSFFAICSTVSRRYLPFQSAILILSIANDLIATLFN